MMAGSLISNDTGLAFPFLLVTLTSVSGAVVVLLVVGLEGNSTPLSGVCEMGNL